MVIKMIQFKPVVSKPIQTDNKLHHFSSCPVLRYLSSLVQCVTRTHSLTPLPCSVDTLKAELIRVVDFTDVECHAVQFVDQ